MKTIIGKILIVFIRLYQESLGRVLPPACRYHPSCSRYALEAIHTYGPIKGCFLALKRVGRCHPWHSGGFDPVP